MSKKKTATNSRKGAGKKTRTGSTAARTTAPTRSSTRARAARGHKVAKNARA